MTPNFRHSSSCAFCARFLCAFDSLRYFLGDHPLLLSILNFFELSDIFDGVAGIYKHMLSDKKFGLTHNLIASKVMPPLIPCTVSPGLDMEQVTLP